MSVLATLLFAGVTVTLPAEAKARGAELELGEIARVECADAALAERVKALSLGYAPAPGYSRLLAADRLRAELARRAPDVEFVLRGEDACRVFPTLERVTGEAIEAAARAVLEEKLLGLDAQASLVERPASLDVPAGASDAQVIANLHAIVVRSGFLTVPIEVRVDQNVYRTVWTNWRVEVWEPRPVLVRAVPAGQTLTADLFEIRRVTTDVGAPIRRLALEQLVGAVAARDLAAQSVVGEADVVRQPLVQPGDSIFLTIRKGSVQARVASTAQHAAARGDRLRVTLNHSKHELTAVLLSRDTAEIDLTSR